MEAPGVTAQRDPRYSLAMSATPKRVREADVEPQDESDYRPREFGRVTWLIKLAEREVGKELDRELRHTGLTKSQFGVLQALMHLKRASSAALARTVFVTPQAMVGIVAGLERKDLIRRRSSKEFAPAIDATVTARGKAVYAEAERMVRKVDDMLAREFTPEEIELYSQFLERTIKALHRSSGTSP
jgi:DNA-binding MarR family transcriptional regulator